MRILITCLFFYLIHLCMLCHRLEEDLQYLEMKTWIEWSLTIVNLDKWWWPHLSIMDAKMSCFHLIMLVIYNSYQTRENQSFIMYHQIWVQIQCCFCDLWHVPQWSSRNSKWLQPLWNRECCWQKQKNGTTISTALKRIFY